MTAVLKSIFFKCYILIFGSKELKTQKNSWVSKDIIFLSTLPPSAVSSLLEMQFTLLCRMLHLVFLFGYKSIHFNIFPAFHDEIYLTFILFRFFFYHFRHDFYGLVNHRSVEHNLKWSVFHSVFWKVSQGAVRQNTCHDFHTGLAGSYHRVTGYYPLGADSML